MWFFFKEKYAENAIFLSTKLFEELTWLKLKSNAQFEAATTSYVSKTFTNLFIRGKPLVFKNKLTLVFIKYFTRGGKNLKILQFFQKAFTELYNTVFNDIEKKKKQFSNFTFIFNMLNLNISSRNINTFFFFLTKYIIYNFYFKVTVLPKFLKKKLKTKYAIEPIFLEKHKRYRATLKILSLNIDLNPARFLKKRFLASFRDLAFNAKKSFFFLEKTAAYAKIFKFFKKKKKLQP